MSFELRPPQKACCQAVYQDLKNGVPSVLASVATGVGKTVIASSLINVWKGEGKRVLFLAHRDELIRQAVEKFWAARKVHAQVEKADEYANLNHDVVVGSVQSLQNERLERWEPNAFDVIITDEAHRSVANTYRSVYKHFSQAQLLGLTATAYRTKGNLSDIYDKVSFNYTIRDAIEDGLLCRLVAETIPLNIDLGVLSSRGGDYSCDELEQKIDPYIERIAQEVWNRGSKRKIILFAPTCATARKCKEIFSRMGFDAFYAGGDDRSELAGFERAGYGSILCNSMLCTEGYDHPQIDACIILRLTKSTGMYCQMVGRITRLFVGKEDAIIYDFLWNSESNNLCKPACLVAEDEEVEERITKLLDKSGKPMDILGEAEVEAVSQIKCERERKLADTLRAFKGRDSGKFDPVLESLAISNGRGEYKAETNWEKATMTHGQERFLRDAGFDPSGWCKGYASTVIGDLSTRNSQGLCSPKQMRTLMRNGHADAADFTKQQASAEMDKLTKKWKKAERWKNIKKDRMVR